MKENKKLIKSLIKIQANYRGLITRKKLQHIGIKQSKGNETNIRFTSIETNIIVWLVNFVYYRLKMN